MQIRELHMNANIVGKNLSDGMNVKNMKSRTSEIISRRIRMKSSGH